MKNYSKKIFQEVPKFLKVLGFKDAYLDTNSNEWVVEFNPTIEITHSNGSIVQGGFVTGMIDASMAQCIMFLSKRKELPLKLDIEVKFLKTYKPNKIVTAKSKIDKKGKSIVFTSGNLYQDDKLIAVASATNKIIKVKD